MPQPLRHPAVWFSALMVWAGLLWFLSSRPGSGVPYPVDHIDKILHFTYFLGGGVLMTGWLFLLNSGSPNWKRIIALSIITLSIIGVLDEWHQSFTAYRSGNDPGDMLADIMGAITGSLAFRTLHRRLR